MDRRLPLVTAAAATLAAAVALDRGRTRRAALRHAAVTGGSRGLGFAVAHELLRRGYRVSICGRDETTLELARRVLSRAGDVAAIPCDLTEPDGARRFVAEAQAAFGPIDVLVNNAATMVVGPLETMTEADFERSMRLHFFAPLRLVRAVLPGMRARRSGRIVNISSIGGRVSPPHLLPYVAGKFALTGLSEGLRAELAGSGIRVTTVCPGLTRTGSPRHVSFKGRFRREHGWFAVSDALPFVSGDARRTARRVVDAAERGRADLITTLPARFGVAFHGLFPGLTAMLFGIAGRWLPRADGVGARTVPGRESGSRWAPSVLTRLADRAAAELNQEPGPPLGREST